MAVMIDNKIDQQTDPFIESVKSAERKAFGRMTAKFIAVIRETGGRGNYDDLLRPMTKSMGLQRDVVNIEKGGV